MDEGSKAGPGLLDPLTLRGVAFRNRIAVSPMCQYSSVDGLASDWHLVHLGSRAVGGAGLVLTEATAVLPEGRISPADTGIWDENQIPPLARIASFLTGAGAVAGIQLAHAGRKASMPSPGRPGAALLPEEGGWAVVGPSPVPFAEGGLVPLPLDEAGIREVIDAFAAGAERASRAGFRVVEVHAAHGYLLHEFLSPLSNQRTDRWGGSLENRTRLLLEVVRAVRSVVAENLALFVRISATDWVEGGWDLPQSIELAKALRAAGVDLVDASSGALVPYATIPAAPGFQVPFAAAIRREGGIATGAVGLITHAAQADAVVREGKADLVLLGREMLREPYWALKAAARLGGDAPWPFQYLRAAPSRV